MAQSGLATLFGLRGADPNSLKVPGAPNVNTTAAQKSAIAGNRKNLPELEKLASETNEATGRQFLQAMERLIPGFSQISSKIAGNILSQVSGELPSDVRKNISRAAAEKGIIRGTKGSEFDDYGELRDLGLTSLQITDKGLDAATRWMKTLDEGAPSFNFNSMFVTPAQRIATDQWNEINRFNTQFLRNQIKMLPSNAEMAGAQILDYVATYATTAASAYSGGAGMGNNMGGGGGGGSSISNYSGGQPFSRAEMADYYGRQ
jgi:hypothetical protein